MSYLRRFFFSTAVFFAGNLSAAPLHLKEVLSTALKNSPTFISAQKQHESRQLERKNAGSIFLPSLDLSAVHGFQGSLPSTYPTPWASATTLTLTENLYDNGVSLAKLKIADFNLKVSDVELQQARGKLILAVSGQYFDFCVANLRVQFAERNQQQIEKQLKLARDQYQQGVKTRKDFVNIQAQSQRATIDLHNARSNFTKARKALLEGMGLIASADLEISSEFKMRIGIKDLPLDVTGVSLREEELIQLQREIGELQVQMSKRKNLPEVNVSAMASYGSSSYIDSGKSWRDSEKTNWNMLLSLNWNLLDFGQRSRNVALVSLENEIAEQKLKSSLLLAQKEIEVLGVDLQNFTKTFELTKSLRKMEEDNLKLLESEYRQGRVGYLELITAMINLLDAQQRDVQTDFDLHRLWLKRKYYEGTLDENIFD